MHCARVLYFYCNDHTISTVHNLQIFTNEICLKVYYAGYLFILHSVTTFKKHKYLTMLIFAKSVKNIFVLAKLKFIRDNCAKNILNYSHTTEDKKCSSIAQGFKKKLKSNVCRVWRLYMMHSCTLSTSSITISHAKLHLS